jgi:hypothetical protein
MVDTLKDMIQKQKQLLSDISHELRSPLTRIQLAQALIRRKQGDSAELARIEGEIARLDKLIGDLLDLSRVQQHVEAPVTLPLAELLSPTFTPLSGPPSAAAQRATRAAFSPGGTGLLLLTGLPPPLQALLVLLAFRVLLALLFTWKQITKKQRCLLFLVFKVHRAIKEYKARLEQLVQLD